MSITPKAQYEKQAKTILARRAKRVDNDMPTDERSEVEAEVVDIYKNAKKADLKKILNEAGVTFGKDDKRDVLLALVLAL